MVTVVTDFEIDTHATDVVVEGTDPGYYAISLGNGDIELRIIGPVWALDQLLDNMRLALDQAARSAAHPA